MVNLSEVEAELGADAFGELKKGLYARTTTEIRVTTSRRENVIAWLTQIGRYVAVWLPEEALPNGTDYVRRLTQFSPAGFDFLVHGQGTVARPVVLAWDEPSSALITLGQMTELPPHAYLSGYDVGDTVVITFGSQQGHICKVRAVQETVVRDQMVYDLVDHLTYKGAGQHVASGVAAVFPGGERANYEAIQPGPVRFPPGTVVAYNGDPDWVVLNWRAGVAELYRLREGLRTESLVRAEKAHLSRVPQPVGHAETPRT